MVHFLGLQYGRELALRVEQQFSPEVRNPFEKKVFYAGQAQRTRMRKLLWRKPGCSRICSGRWNLEALAQAGRD